MNEIWLIIFFGSYTAGGMYIPFKDMAACQDAKTIIMADAPYHVGKAYCVPTKR